MSSKRSRFPVIPRRKRGRCLQSQLSQRRPSIIQRPQHMDLQCTGQALDLRPILHVLPLQHVPCGPEATSCVGSKWTASGRPNRTEPSGTSRRAELSAAGVVSSPSSRQARSISHVNHLRLVVRPALRCSQLPESSCAFFFLGPFFS